MSEKSDADGERPPPSLQELIQLRAMLDAAAIGTARFLLLVTEVNSGDVMEYKEYEVKGQFRLLWELAFERVKKDHKVNLSREAGGATFRTEDTAYVLLMIRD